MTTILGGLAPIEIDCSHLIPAKDYANRFPPYHRLSKAVRRMKLGRTAAGAFADSYFFVFVIDKDFGVCPLTVVEPFQLHRNPRTGKTHFDFRTDYEKYNVSVMAVRLPNRPSAAQLAEMQTAILQAMLPELTDSATPWFAPAGINRGCLQVIGLRNAD